jgi:hypothetical protein
MFFEVTHGVDAGAFVGEQDITNAQNKRFGHGLLHEVCLNMAVPIFLAGNGFLFSSAAGFFP